MCKVRDINVIFVIVPVADSEIWKNNNWDDFLFDIEKISDENRCELYDFNLLRCRYDIFYDDVSFWGSAHLDGVGGEAFTEEYCNVMNKVNSGEDVSSLFYSSYEEMKADSPYWQYMN